MHTQSHEPPVDIRMSEAETIALAYLRDAKGDRWEALVRLAEDALGDLASAEAAIRERGRQVSRGYVRGPVDG